MENNVMNIDNMYMKDINNLDLNILTYEEEQELFKKIKNDDVKSREKLIYHNLKLVIYIAKQYINNHSNISFDELIQVGNEALIKAVDTFDYTKGYKFSSYSYRCIENEIIKYLKKNDLNLYSLDLYDYKNEVYVYDCLEDENACNLLDKVEQKVFFSQFLKYIQSSKCLTERQKIALIYHEYYGIKYDDIAKILGISKARVDQLEKIAIKNIRNDKDFNQFNINEIKSKKVKEIQEEVKKTPRIDYHEVLEILGKRRSMMISDEEYARYYSEEPQRRKRF